MSTNDRRALSAVAPAGHGAALSERERQVLELLATGLTNAEIGERLYLSVNSIKTHLRSAYRKLGVHRRTEATRWVLEQSRGPADAARCPTCGRPAAELVEPGSLMCG
jgi:DNA-binding NarL/FixJ family response regulator